MQSKALCRTTEESNQYLRYNEDPLVARRHRCINIAAVVALSFDNSLSIRLLTMGSSFSAYKQMFPGKPQWTADHLRDLSGKVMLVTGKASVLILSSREFTLT